MIGREFISGINKNKDLGRGNKQIIFIAMKIT